ncbi:MAG TPA: cytochrome c biogenesis protein [Candidatus Acidoferrum sp.]|jgi:heme exporter protein C|nr:cytochrome c biogenesis protein [Candidatus Acidoferrum sp.]
MWKRAMIGAFVLFLVGAAAYASFFIAPEEKTMHVLQRIFYFHAAAAWAGMTAFFICFVANLLYVWRREERWDSLGISSAEVGLAFITVVLITGPIWAKPAWGIYWTWDARLTSTFVLWLLYISYLLLRTLIEEPDRRALLSALFGIFAFIDVPIVFGAIRWWRTQHPAPVIMGGPGSGLDPTMNKVFFFSVLAMHALMVFLIAERYRLEKLRTDFEVVRREAEAI